ncbi:hypothetical protein JY96_13640 [Aquabacterium sp. NJ1]|uniref:hypothetical protein n=1 Tax=Aquabacterium sp. NJ1 TaxID=1538295 RepID=UPI00052E45DE|nr:hypothetical protein [Aquabacterium sp. NJ1]KGM40736.1 hypothetical protein JY96_13640 [Aquabacterium sp. NJ1]
MIARPVTRPRPIPYAEQAPGSKTTSPVSWAASSGPAPLAGMPAAAPPPRTVATLLAPTAPARRSPVRVAANDVVQNAANDAAATPPRQAARQAATATPTASGTPASGELQARFTGHGALSVRSSVTGRHYRFQGHGDCQKIDKHDMMMLRRIPDLIVS